MTDTQIDINGWSQWLEDHRTIASKLSGANRENREAYFLITHAATEAMFRRILLVGLRLNKVTFQEASEWLFHNDNTPEKEKYPKLFDQLYKQKNLTWSGIIRSDPDIERLWGLWLGYSKTIRNHISHGIRKYSDNWLLPGITIDQELLVRLDQALSALIGGSVCANLDKFSPRLPIGTKGIDLCVVTGRKPKNPRLSASLSSVIIAINELSPRIQRL